ncbi:M20/M25/M40 family metallo-hydrolase [Streptomyces sp. INA 01156]
MGPPHRRGQRHRRRLPGPRQQDDHPLLGDGQTLLPAGRRPGPDHIEKAVRDWTAGQIPEGIRCESTFRPATRPCLTPLDHPALESVARAMGRAFGTPVRFTREGGSGPAADLQDVLGAPVLFLGISIPSDGWHAPDEKVELDLLLKGAETTAHLWSDLAEHWRPVP